jgi:SAM-dependent methyltransferase
MFGNVINRHDLITLVKTMKYIKLKELFSHIFHKKQERVKATWDGQSIPYWPIELQKRVNYLVSKNPDIDYFEYICRKYLSGRDSLIVLSLGCGSGEGEVMWAKQGHFKTIDAYDLSESRIKMATRRAKEEGLDGILKFYVRDIVKLEVKKEYYDIVLVGSSLHHFSPLEKVIGIIKESLKPNGYLFICDFVGPTRFQWTDRQLVVANALLSILPDRYKKTMRGDYKKKIFRPGYLRMILIDPSEAIESSKIMPLLHKYFEIVELKEIGGTIINLVFTKIAHNFRPEDAIAKRFLRICADVEDLLMEIDDIESDHVVAICKKVSDPKGKVKI